MKECKIVQDLLPNYIEGLTSEDTREYIEKHIENCKECKRVLENMRNEIQLDTKKQDEREVKYLKKFSKQLAICKLLILFIIVIFLSIIGKRIYVITKLSNTAEKNINSENYHYINYQSYAGMYSKYEIYYINGKWKYVYERKGQYGDTEGTIYGKEVVKRGESPVDDIYIVDFFSDTEPKSAMLNEETSMSLRLNNSLRTDNVWQLLWLALNTSVKETNYNNEECYLLTNTEGQMHFSKETGLKVGETYTNKDEYYGGVNEWKYEFGTVTEEDMKEPDISEYIVQ